MIHPARIFTLFMVLFLVLVCLFTVNPPNLVIPYYLTLVIFTFLALFWPKKAIRYTLLCLAIGVIALLRVQQLTPVNNADWWTSSVGTKVNTKVIISSEARVSGKNQVFLVTTYDNKPRGNLEVYTNQFPVRHFGDVIEIDGKLLLITGNISASKSQQIVGRLSYPKIKELPPNYPTLLGRIYFPTRRYLIGIKDQYVLKTGQILPEPEAGLLSGIIFGTKAELSSYIISILAICGTVHIIALSGYNITIVAKGSQYVTNRFGRTFAFWGPVAGIMLFVLATGLSASVIRAAIMGIVLLLAAYLGRQSDALNSVLFASCIMAFFNPYIVLFDVGFQLSFAAVVGIIFLQPILEPYFSRFGKVVGPILAGTVAAQLFSWPVIAYYFGRVSVISIVTNALVLPIIPLVMLIGFIVVSIGFISLGVAKVLGIIIWFLLYYILKVNEILAGLKIASFTYENPSLYLLIGYFLVLLEITYFFYQRKQKNNV